MATAPLTMDDLLAFYTYGNIDLLAAKSRLSTATAIADLVPECVERASQECAELGERLARITQAMRDLADDDDPVSPCTGVGCAECGSGCDRDYGDD